MPRKYEDQVKAGMTFLDSQLDPGWRRYLIGVHFNMRYPCTCVLGHLPLRMNYYEALRHFGLTQYEAERLGFTLSLWEDGEPRNARMEDWRELSAEWERQLAEGEAG